MYLSSKVGEKNEKKTSKKIEDMFTCHKRILNDRNALCFKFHVFNFKQCTQYWFILSISIL